MSLVWMSSPLWKKMATFGCDQNYSRKPHKHRANCSVLSMLPIFIFFPRIEQILSDPPESCAEGLWGLGSWRSGSWASTRAVRPHLIPAWLHSAAAELQLQKAVALLCGVGSRKRHRRGVACTFPLFPLPLLFYFCSLHLFSCIFWTCVVESIWLNWDILKPCGIWQSYFYAVL